MCFGMCNVCITAETHNESKTSQIKQNGMYVRLYTIRIDSVQERLNRLNRWQIYDSSLCCACCESLKSTKTFAKTEFSQLCKCDSNGFSSLVANNAVQFIMQRKVEKSFVKLICVNFCSMYYLMFAVAKSMEMQKAVKKNRTIDFKEKEYWPTP